MRKISMNDTGNGLITTVSIWSEKIDGKGEDGPPLILLSEDYSFGVIAVTDGVGGAGSRQVSIGDERASGAKLAAAKLLEIIFGFFKDAWLLGPTYANTAQDPTRATDDESPPRPHSDSDASHPNTIRQSTASHEQMAGPSPANLSADDGASVSSRSGTSQTCRQLKPYHSAQVGKCSAYLVPGAVCEPSIAQQLERLGKKIDDAFEKMNADLAETQSASRLKSKIQRNLPSTLAGWVYRTAPDKEVTAFWSGDSRCYVLCADGLRQISEDDAKGNCDALEAIWADPPLTTYISERTPNNIKQRRLSYEKPALLICASDGAFNYLPTPMDFEYVILNSLASSQNIQSWAEDLSTRLQAITGDDVSIVLHPLGFDNFDELKTFYNTRLDKLAEHFIDPLKVLHDKQAQLERELASVKSKTKEKTQEAWEQYRMVYEQHLHEGNLE